MLELIPVVYFFFTLGHFLIIFARLSLQSGTMNFLTGDRIHATVHSLGVPAPYDPLAAAALGVTGLMVALGLEVSLFQFCIFHMDRTP